MWDNQFKVTQIKKVRIKHKLLVKVRIMQLINYFIQNKNSFATDINSKFICLEKFCALQISVILINNTMNSF